MKIDGHVHFVGDGSNDSGCWLRCSTLLDRMVEPIVKAQAGILKSSRQLGVDQAYEERLINLINRNPFMLFFFFAMDYPYDPSGNCLEAKSKSSMYPMIMYSIWPKNILKSSPPVRFIQPEQMQSKNLNAVQKKVPKY